MVNGNEAIVGNCCVKRFIGLPSEKIFDAIKRVSADLDKPLNTETVDHAHRKGWINDWERTFYFDTMRKRRLSAKQIAKRLQINSKILNYVTSTRKW